jgi:hypothetical protein
VTNRILQSAVADGLATSITGCSFLHARACLNACAHVATGTASGSAQLWHGRAKWALPLHDVVAESAVPAARHAYIMPPMPPIPPMGGNGAASLSGGASTTMHSEVVISELTDAASRSAVRTTFKGSMMPAQHA